MRFLQYHKKIWVSALIVLLAAAIVITYDRKKPTFLENSVGFVITGAQGLLKEGTDFVSSKIDFVANLSHLEAENDDLRQILAANESEIARLKRLEEENAQLSNLLKIDSKYPDHEKIGADIIAKDYGLWYDNFTINKGTRDGVEKNMVVLGDGGLVGRVLESGYNYAKVVTMIDDVDAISAKNLRTGDIGFVRGDIVSQGICRMEYIDMEAEIVVGDEIITSHLSVIYPPGLTMGYVKEIHTDANTLTKYALVEPNVDFKHLETVLIITEKFEPIYEEELPAQTQPTAEPS